MAAPAGNEAVADELPLFPLHCVLFPGGRLALRIFEARYIDMIGRCLKGGHGFGVVTIREGSEVGEADIFAIGTLAEIVNWSRSDDGLLGIDVTGKQRFEVGRVRRQEDGLYLGRVTLRSPQPRAPVPADLAFVVDFVRAGLTAMEARGRAEANYDDAAWVGYRLAELLPLALVARQALLEIDAPIARLERLADALARLRSRPLN